MFRLKGVVSEVKFTPFPWGFIGSCVPFIFVPLHVCVLQVFVGFLKEIYFCLSNFYKAEKWSGMDCPMHRPKVGDGKFLSYIN